MSGFSFKKIFNDTANRTISKIKGQDNPSYYQAPDGFIKYDLPLPTDITDVNIIEFTNYIQSIIPNNRDNAIRLYSLLEPNEQILYAVNGTIKQTYLIVITNLNRIIFTSKESYKILKKDDIKTSGIKSTGVLGIDFVINDIVFLGGNEKDLIYNFLKALQNKKDEEDVKLIENNNISRNLNFVELIKLNALNKMVPRQEINSLLISLLKTDELILTAIYGNTNYKNYVLAITSEKNLYMISKDDHLVLTLDQVRSHECVKMGILTVEFTINNFYFINGGNKDNIEIFFNLFDDVYFDKVRELVLGNTRELVEFDFTDTINLLTKDYRGFIINEQNQKMIVANGLQDLNILNFKDIIRYELPHNFYLKSDNYVTKTNTELFNVYDDINEITRNSTPTEDIVLTLHTRLSTRKEITIEFIKDVLFDNNLSKEKYDEILNLVQKILNFLDKILAKTSFQKIAQAQIARESAYEELRKLKKLAEDGVISEDDYEKKKKEILDIK